MNCLEVVENFSAYYEDLLDYQSLKHFETHMSACSECQREYNQFSQSIKVTQELPQIEPSPFFLTTLEHRLVGNEREAITLWEKISRFFKMPHFNVAHFNIKKGALTMAVVLLMVAATVTVVFRDDVFHQEKQSNITNTGISSERQNIDRNEFFPIELGSDFSSIGVSPLMQQNYTLKQVSYSTVSTGGGL